MRFKAENCGFLKKLINFTELKIRLSMKKIMITLFVAVVATFIFSSCAGSRPGYGCPNTSTTNKPFRA